MTQSMTRLGRARAFTAMLAIIGVTAVMAGAKTARAFDLQASDAAEDDAINRQVAGQDHAVVPQPGPYASARRDRRVVTAPAARRDFQDMK